MTAWQAVMTVGRLLDSDRTVIKAGGGEIPPQNTDFLIYHRP